MFNAAPTNDWFEQEENEVAAAEANEKYEEFIRFLESLDDERELKYE